MLSRFILPFADVGSGVKPPSGAQLFFFETGTSTPKDTFNCPDGTFANSNPVIADSTGLFPDIFLLLGSYKVILKDSKDVQIWEADPVDSVLLFTDAAFIKNFDNLATVIAEVGLVENDAVTLKERVTGNGGESTWDVVLASSVTPNTYDIVQCVGAPTLALVLRIGTTVDVLDFQDANSDAGNWTTAVAAAITNALATRGKEVVCDLELPVSKLVLPAQTRIRLNLTNYDNNNILILNGDNVDLTTTAIKPKAGFSGWCLIVDDTLPEATSNIFSRLNATYFLLDCLGAQASKGIKVNLTHSSASFWDILFLDIKAAAKGLVVTVSATGASDVAFFNSNTINATIWSFIDEPLILSSDDTGAGISEVSNNFIHAQVQPGLNTVDGIYLLGGRSCSRNRIDGIMWDWSSIKTATDNQALTDLGENNIVEGFPTDFVSQNRTTNYVPADGAVRTNGVALIPGDDTDRTVAGRQDNILAFANKRADMTVTLSDPFDFGTEDTLFSSNQHDSVRWNVANQTEERTVFIEFNGANRIMSHASATSLFNGIPLNVKIEFLNADLSTFTLYVDRTNDIAPTSGRGNITRAYGVKFTFSAPQNLNVVTGQATDSSIIALNTLFVKSLTGAEWSPHMATFEPQYYGNMRIDEIITLDITTKNQTKAIRVMDIDGVLVGYIPISVDP